MSKSIKIPECANPFVVHVNGKVYSYTAGTEQIVPDEVAVVIEAHNKKHEEAAIPVEAPFVSGGGLPVVELSAGFAPGATFTGEDKEKLWAAYKKGMPTIIKCDISAGGMTYKNGSMVWSLAESEGDFKFASFVASVGGAMLMIMTPVMGDGDEASWSCMVQ